MKFGVVVNQNMKGTISRQILDRTPPQQGTLILTLLFIELHFPHKNHTAAFYTEKIFQVGNFKCPRN